MDRLDAMKLFVSAVEAGSLAAAGRRHGRSPATVTRAIALLEHDAGEPLMLRSTRQLALTPAGERRLQVWYEVLAKLREVESGGTGPLQGSVALTAPELFGTLHVMPLVEEFLSSHRQVEVRVLLANRLINMIGEGIDVAVRLSPLPDSTLKAVKFGEVRTVLCASPGYLDSAGLPTGPGDLQRHQCIGLNVDADGELWTFDGGGPRARSIRVRTRLSVNNAAAAIAAAVRGSGIVQARSYQVADHIDAGRLVRVLPQFESSAVPAHIVFPADRTRSRVVRALIDYLTPGLKRSLAAVGTRPA